MRPTTTCTRTCLHALHLDARAVGWCRSPATRCRSATARARSPSTTSAARPPRSSTSATWASSSSTGPAWRRRSRGWCPPSVSGLGVRRMRYTVLTTEDGGVIDDVMITNDGDDHLTLVVNAGGKEADVEHLRAGLPAAVSVEHRPDLALLALQGPAAAAVVARHDPAAAELVFMQTGDGHDRRHPGRRQPLRLHRRGRLRDHRRRRPGRRTGRALLAEPEVELAGLAARDSLRLEAGLCLYGHDLDRSDQPGRGRPGLDHPGPPPGGGRLPRRGRRILASWRDGPRPPPGRPAPRGPQAGAGRRPPCARRRRSPGSAPSPAAATAPPPAAHRHGLRRR